jgi:hypothetical protein
MQRESSGDPRCSSARLDFDFETPLWRKRRFSVGDSAKKWAFRPRGVSTLKSAQVKLQRESSGDPRCSSARREFEFETPLGRKRRFSVGGSAPKKWAFRPRGVSTLKSAQVELQRESSGDPRCNSTRLDFDFETPLGRKRRFSVGDSPTILAAVPLGRNSILKHLSGELARVCRVRELLGFSN